MTWPLLAATGTAIVCTLMLVLWLIHLRTGNAGIVDFGWAAGLALLGAHYGLFAGGYGPRRVLIAAMASIWGWRLALYLLTTRVIGHPEEGRYVQLRAEWKTNLPAKFFLFFQAQALLDVLLSIPFLVAAINPALELAAIEWAGFAVWIVAMVMEGLADAQLHRFKSNPANKGKVCRDGLWKFSRHPNYFAQWMIWVGFALFALGSPHGWLGLLSPALILYFLLFVTGIPPTEAQSIRSRGDAYREYQRTTSAFVPWFPKA